MASSHFDQDALLLDLVASTQLHSTLQSPRSSVGRVVPRIRSADGQEEDNSWKQSWDRPQDTALRRGFMMLRDDFED